MEKKDIFRNLKFSAITIFSGIALILVLFTFESNPFKEESYKLIYPNIASEIQKDIRSYEDRKYSIDKYSNLLAHINSASINGLISTNEALDFQVEVLNLYEKRVLNKCYYFMKHGGTNFNEHKKELIDLSITIGAKKEFQDIFNQINNIEDYIFFYPIIIDNYIAKQRSIYRYLDYNEYENKQLINYLQNPDKINSYYMSTNPTLYNVKNKLINKLNKLHNDVENCILYGVGC